MYFFANIQQTCKNTIIKMLILIVLLGHDAFYDFWQIKGGIVCIEENYRCINGQRPGLIILYSKSLNSVHLCPKNILCYSKPRYLNLYQDASQKSYYCNKKLIALYSRTHCIQFLTVIYGKIYVPILKSMRVKLSKIEHQRTEQSINYQQKVRVLKFW